jgi:SnoaL-like domain
MLSSRKAGVSAGGFLGSVLVSCAAFVMATTAEPARAEQPATTLATLLDKAQIQDMLVDYYGHLGGGGGSFGSFYVPDGILDVNGLVAQGQQPIEDLYKKIAAGSPPHKGAFRMLLTNPKIVVNGATATADVIWTGINSDTPESIPQFVEQGREHDELVKQNGHWLFKHRYISSDGGLQPMFEKTYKKR